MENIVKRISAAAFAVLLTAGGILYSQDGLDLGGYRNELGLAGTFEDAKRYPRPAHQNNQIIFARLVYTGRIPYYYKGWYTDFPKADRLLIQGLQRLTTLDIADQGVVVPINDPELFQYPFIYSSEVGQIVLSPEDAATMREYLLRGGFWFMDDFWGTSEWASMEAQMKKIFPDLEIKDIPLTHPIFHMVFDIDKLVQTPNSGYKQTGITYEQDGFIPECKGIFDEKGRLMVVINHNTDLGDSYEWADDPDYPMKFTGYGYRHALNIIMYAMSH